MQNCPSKAVLEDLIKSAHAERARVLAAEASGSLKNAEDGEEDIDVDIDNDGDAEPTSPRGVEPPVKEPVEVKEPPKEQPKEHIEPPKQTPVETLQDNDDDKEEDDAPIPGSRPPEATPKAESKHPLPQNIVDPLEAVDSEGSDEFSSFSASAPYLDSSHWSLLIDFHYCRRGH